MCGLYVLKGKPLTDTNYKNPVNATYADVVQNKNTANASQVMRISKSVDHFEVDKSDDGCQADNGSTNFKLDSEEKSHRQTSDNSEERRQTVSSKLPVKNNYFVKNNEIAESVMPAKAELWHK